MRHLAPSPSLMPMPMPISNRHRILSALLLAAALAALPAAGRAQTAADLGKSLTPVGADPRPNADGSIPAWTGGARELLSWTDPDNYPNPYADEKPLAVITAANLAQYQDKLSAGHIALLKKYPATYSVPLYKTHRSAFFAQSVYDETALNPGRAKLANGGVTGSPGGVPFPIPKTGEEVILNHKFRFMGAAYGQTLTNVNVAPNGDVSASKLEYELFREHGNPRIKPEARVPNMLSYYLERKLSPAREAGEMVLAHSLISAAPGTPFQSIWIYSPGQRRVRLAPEFAYDTPQRDGMVTSDELDEFNGGTDRYDWKLLGKRELIVPYSNYAMLQSGAKAADILKPGHVNPAFMRYELHRVWVVEATLKKGASHIYAKRVFYVDEDSWCAVVQEKYDQRGELWRVSETVPVIAPWLGGVFTSTDNFYDLRSGRYLTSLTNDSKPKFKLLNDRSADYYSPQNLRNLGTR